MSIYKIKNIYKKTKSTLKNISKKTKSTIKNISKKNNTKKIKPIVFPYTRPIQKSFIPVSDIHNVAYYLYGNINGKPVLILHGGPGAGTFHYEARFFDPTKFLIVMIDQRGTGKSTPSGEITDNTTLHLISDCEKIRKLLNIDKWIIYGGSWGSTLALAYSIKHPSHVSNMILSAIYLSSSKELDWVQKGKGANLIYPDKWTYYRDFIPSNERNDFIKAYGKRIFHNHDTKLQKKAALQWLAWEESLAPFKNITHQQIIKSLKKIDYLSYAKIHFHYVSNNCFFPTNDFLIQPKNIKKIKHIPTLILHGRYDILCPYDNAFQLHSRLPNSILKTTISSHNYSQQQIKIITNYIKNTF